MQTVATQIQPVSATPLHRTLAGRAALVVAASLFVAICAHIALPLPFTPVPLSLVTFGVLLTGLALSPQAAFAAMALYLAEGASGLPVFAPTGPGGLAQLLGPTAGYLFSYPLAAALASYTVRNSRLPLSRFATAVLACALATAVTLTLGTTWLASLLHLQPVAALSMAVLPFLPGEALKIAAAAGIYAGVQRLRSR